jgi:transcriptional regulator with XRE-family HTH domain
MNAIKPLANRPDPRMGNGALLHVNMDWKRLGRDIRARRIEKNLTMRQVAEWHGLSHSSISRLEARGTHCSVETLLTLTIMLEIDLFSYVFATPAAAANTGPLTLAAIMTTA